MTVHWQNHEDRHREAERDLTCRTSDLSDPTRTGSCQGHLLRLDTETEDTERRSSRPIRNSGAQGDLIIRPSSKGENHLTVTWKVTQGIYQHIDVREEGKENAFSLGHTLWINAEKMEEVLVKAKKEKPAFIPTTCRPAGTAGEVPPGVPAQGQATGHQSGCHIHNSKYHHNTTDDDWRLCLSDYDMTMNQGATSRRPVGQTALQDFSRRSRRPGSLRAGSSKDADPDLTRAVSALAPNMTSQMFNAIARTPTPTRPSGTSSQYAYSGGGGSSTGGGGSRQRLPPRHHALMTPSYSYATPSQLQSAGTPQYPSGTPQSSHGGRPSSSTPNSSTSTSSSRHRTPQLQGKTWL
ncbi:hypothetical protein CRUP_029382 [Coryphaenoides rupestris]|nr:hypothetical protein CRUP_029382 [Coryphaenoides rupestris]